MKEARQQILAWGGPECLGVHLCTKTYLKVLGKFFADPTIGLSCIFTYNRSWHYTSDHLSRYWNEYSTCSQSVTDPVNLSHEFLHDELTVRFGHRAMNCLIMWRRYT